MTRGYVCVHAFIFAAASIRRRLSVPLICCSLAVSAIGQTDGSNGKLITCMGMVQSNGVGVVAVELDDGTQTRYHADVDGGGYFRLSGVPAGDYNVRVIDRSGNQADTQFVSIRGGMPLLLVRAPERRTTVSGWGTVSAARLEHKIPKNARKEMERAAHAVEHGDSGASIDHLKKAIAADPDFMEAHNSLGARYMSTGAYQLALEEFQSALKLDLGNPVVNSNIAAALLALGRPSEAETAARSSVRLNGANARARYLLASALIEQHKLSPEVENSLREAADQFPAAHLLLGKVFIASGKADEAEIELKSYLASGRPQERSMVEEWLQKRELSRERGADDTTTKLSKSEPKLAGR